MNEELLLALLRFDLYRMGAQPDDEYLKTLLRAAKLDIQRSGIKLPEISDEDVEEPENVEDYQTMVVGTAAWMYLKRRTGEDMPRYVRMLRSRALLAQKAGEGFA